MTEASLLVSQVGSDTLRRAYETISRKVGDLDFAIPEVIIYKGGSTLEMPLSPEQIYEKIVLNHFNYELREAGAWNSAILETFSRLSDWLMCSTLWPLTSLDSLWRPNCPLIILQTFLSW